MSGMMYWGEKGEYGPFTMQEDGWPHAGEVVRYYRKKRKMNAVRLALLYSEAIGTSVSARWMLKMEQQNQVPTDILRRRVLIKILQIPPLLLGLASLEKPASVETAKTYTPITLEYTSLDLEQHLEKARVFWKLHYAQTAHDVLSNLLADINMLVPLQQDTKGNLAEHINELLNSYYRLAATIQRDCGNFEEAYTLANESVRFAKAMGKSSYASQIIAASQYTRGVVKLAWGVFGDQVKKGTIVPQTGKIERAYTDFEQSLKYASPQLKGIIYSEMARAKALIAMSASDATISLKLIEQAEHFIDADQNNDFYTQILLKGLDTRRLILGRAKTFLAIHRPGKALEELSELELLTDGPSHTRRRAWTRLLSAQASFDVGDYATAISETTLALGDCKEAYSVTHLARVNELYHRFLLSPYKDHAEVKRLKRLLHQDFAL